MGFYYTFALILDSSLFAVVLLLNSSFMNEHYIILFSLVPVHFPLMQFIIIYFLLESHEGMIKYKKGKKNLFGPTLQVH